MCSTGFALSQEGTLAAALSKETKAPKKNELGAWCFELCSLMYFERRMLLLTLLKQSTKHKVPSSFYSFGALAVSLTPHDDDP